MPERVKPTTGMVATVVAGILIERRMFLVEKRRNDDQADPGYVEIPGGHADPDETLEDALRREMREELGIEVETARFVQKSLATATNGERQRIHYFHVEKWRGKIESKEAERVYWESEVSNLSIIPDRRAVRRILKAKNQSQWIGWAPCETGRSPAPNPEFRPTEKLGSLQRTAV